RAATVARRPRPRPGRTGGCRRGRAGGGTSVPCWRPGWAGRCRGWWWSRQHLREGGEHEHLELAFRQPETGHALDARVDLDLGLGNRGGSGRGRRDRRRRPRARGHRELLLVHLRWAEPHPEPRDLLLARARRDDRDVQDVAVDDVADLVDEPDDHRSGLARMYA